MDDHFRDHDAQIRFVLFVAGQSPRSKRARNMIDRVFEARGLDPRQVEVVDVLTESSVALVHRIVAVPALNATGRESNRWLYGDLLDEPRFVRWLDEVLGSDAPSMRS